MRPRALDEIHDARRYTTTAATLIAGDDIFDGHNYERSGRNCFLYRTPRGRFFLAHQTTIAGERDHIEPLDLDAAIVAFERLAARRMEWPEAFPGLTIEEA